jgi:hypothetical protein
MVDTHWDGLRGKELRYRGNAWELTGDVGVRQNGELLAVEAKQADDVRRRTATLHFGLDGSASSLNPGNLGDNLESLERDDDGQHIVVKKGDRRYRYELRRMEGA